MFWSDVWNDNLLEHKFPRLYSFVKNKNISVASFLQNNQIEQKFHVPLSIQAFQEYQEMQDIIQQIQVSNEEKDIWKYFWGDNTYTAPKFYHPPYKNMQPPKPFIWIWKSSLLG
jgi:hypothetical protein